MTHTLRPEDTIAVVVGIEQYAVSPDWDLDGPASDAIRFVHWLRRRGVPDPNILLFLSPLECNKHLVRDTVDAGNGTLYADRIKGIQIRMAYSHLIHAMLATELARRASTARFLLVYWGGHGVVLKPRSRLLFCCDGSEYGAIAMDVDSILDMLRSRPWSSFTKQIIIFDTCANFLEEMRHRHSPSLIKLIAGPRAEGVSQTVLFAAAAGQIALNESARKTGAFSEIILASLANGGNGCWPPDGEALFLEARGHFQRLREQGKLRQRPVLLEWEIPDRDGSKVFGECPVSREVLESVSHVGVEIGRLRALAALIVERCDLLEGEVRNDLVNSFVAIGGGPCPCRSQDAETDLMALVATAIRTRDGIETLLKVLRARSDAAALHTIELGIDSLRAVAAAWDLLRDVPLRMQDLDKLYRRSVPDPQRTIPVTDLDAIIEALCRMPPRHTGGLLPLVEFLERVARRCGRRELHDWVDRQAPNKALVADLRHRLRQEEQNAAQRFSYLLVDVPSNAPDRLQFWWLDGSHDCKIHDEAVCERSLDGVRTALTHVLNLIVSSTESNVLIELFVPATMLACDADQWEIDYGLNENPRIGELHPTVLRWRERAGRTGNTRSGVWRRIAKRIRDSSASGRNACCVDWISMDHGPGVRLMDNLEKGAYGGCLGFLFTPIDEHGGSAHDLLKCALLGGMPFGIWLRCEPPDWAEFRAEIDALLSSVEFDEVPYVFKDFRVKAAGDGNSTGPARCLTLFWDDPLRNPLAPRLEQIPQRLDSGISNDEP